MSKYLRNGLLIFTNNGLKKIEDRDKKINQILDGKK